MKVAVHRKSLRFPFSLRATGVWSGQSGSSHTRDFKTGYPAGRRALLFQCEGQVGPVSVYSDRAR